MHDYLEIIPCIRPKRGRVFLSGLSQSKGLPMADNLLSTTGIKPETPLSLKDDEPATTSAGSESEDGSTRDASTLPSLESG